MNSDPHPWAAWQVAGIMLFLGGLTIGLLAVAMLVRLRVLRRRDLRRVAEWQASQPADTGQRMVGGIRCEWFGTCWNTARLWRIDGQGSRVPICGACNEKANRVARR